MSDEEEYSDEEEVSKKEPEKKAPTAAAHHEDEGPQGADVLKHRQDQKRAELEIQLKEYIDEWRKQRVKEEEDLKRLKEKQAKRKVLREEEDKKLAMMKKEEEDRLRRLVEEKKQSELEEKRRRLAEVEQKRQAADKVSKDKAAISSNFKVVKKGAVDPSQAQASTGGMDKFSNVESARNDLLKSKEQLEEEKKISLSFRIKPLDIDGLGTEGLKKKAAELWQQIVTLETEKYDLEERSKRQDYDLKELKERQRQQNRQKALKLGLDPEALTGKYPPKVKLASKFERKFDQRTFVDKKGLFDGGWIATYSESEEKAWKDKYEAFQTREYKAKLPKWFGERPGKKKGETDSPDGEEAEAKDTLEDFMEAHPPAPVVEEEEPEEEEEEEE